MAYIKKTWIPREGTNLNKFTKTSETASSVILENAPDAITQAGTPFTAEAMNNIEDGVDASLKKDVTGEINALTAKTAPAASDVVVIEDSADSYAKKKTTLTALVSSMLTALGVSSAITTLQGYFSDGIANATRKLEIHFLSGTASVPISIASRTYNVAGHKIYVGSYWSDGPLGSIATAMWLEHMGDAWRTTQYASLYGAGTTDARRWVRMINDTGVATNWKQLTDADGNAINANNANNAVHQLGATGLQGTFTGAQLVTAVNTALGATSYSAGLNGGVRVSNNSYDVSQITNQGGEAYLYSINSVGGALSTMRLDTDYANTTFVVSLTL